MRKGQRQPLTRFGMAEILGEPKGDLSEHGLDCAGSIHWNLPVETLVELAVSRGEGWQHTQTRHAHRLPTTRPHAAAAAAAQSQPAA